MSYFEFPHTRTYDNDLGWIIKHLIIMQTSLDNFINFNTIKYADPIGWNITTQYEANTVVINPVDGTAYISTKPVPSGVNIRNTDYWTPIFNYGESMETLREQIASANEGTSATAGSAYTEGELLFWRDELYRVLYDFPAGTALIPGTNIESVTIESVIDDLGDTVNESITSIENNITSIENKIQNGLHVTPEQFGAAGDGTTDDTAALQEAFNSGKPVYLANRYKITSQILLPSNLLAYGHGTIIDNVPETTSTSRTEIASILAYRVDNIVFDGIHFEGMGYRSHYANKYTVLLQNSTYAEFRNCYFSNIEGAHAIYARSSNQITIDHCRCHDYTYGGFAFGEGTSQARITYCEVVDGHETQGSNRYPIALCLYDLVYTDENRGAIAYDLEAGYNYIYDSSPFWEGIDAHGGNRVWIHDNTVLGTASGIAAFTDKSRGFTLSNAWIENNYIENSLEPTTPNNRFGCSFGGENVHFENNIIINGGFCTQADTSCGLYIQYGAPAYVRNNRISNSYRAAVMVSGWEDELYIRDNTFDRAVARNNYSYGIEFWSGGLGYLRECRIWDNNFAGVNYEIRALSRVTVAGQLVDLRGNTYDKTPLFINMEGLSPDISIPSTIAQTHMGENGKMCMNANARINGIYGWVMYGAENHLGTWRALHDRDTFVGTPQTYTFTPDGTVGEKQNTNFIVNPTPPEGYTLIGYIANSANAVIINPSATTNGILSWYQRSNSTNQAQINVFPVFTNLANI